MPRIVAFRLDPMASNAAATISISMSTSGSSPEAAKHRCCIQPALARALVSCCCFDCPLTAFAHVRRLPSLGLGSSASGVGALRLVYISFFSRVCSECFG